LHARSRALARVRRASAPAMGNCSSADAGPCEAQAPMPSSLLWVKVIRVNGIRTPNRLNGDTIRKCANQVLGRAHSIRIYAVISVGKQQGTTEWADVVDKGVFELNQPPVPFTLDNIVANTSTRSSTSRQLTPPSRARSSSIAVSLASTLLDRRIPEMTVRVYRVRRMCRDALIGQAALPITTTELAGTSREHTVDLTNGCGKVSVRFSFNCSLSDLRDLQSVLAAPNERRSSAKFSRALAQLLQGEDGLQILEKAMPAALVMMADRDPDGMASTLQCMLVSLCNHVTMLAEGESNSEVMQRLAPLSRNIQDFVAEHAPAGEDVSALATEWLSDIFTICARKTGLMGAWSLDIKEFLEAGARYPGVDHLAPIDSQGRQIQEWTDSPLSVRKQFTPKGAILGQGMFGTVWRAMDVRNREWYAVKRSQGREVFIGRERDVTNHVMMNPHPFVVQVFGNYVVEGSARFSLLVMEFCSGGDLQNRINAAHRGSAYSMPAKVWAWIGQIFLGLEHLHVVLDMLVRDLKPANVVFTGHDHAKLTDFGMGRIGSTSTGAFTLQNCPPGSPAYAAPEVVLERPYDHRADIYSFGVLCWTMLTGGIKVEGPDWCPPSHKFSAHNFKSLAKNHKLLERAIRNPSQACAQPLPSERAVDMVLALTRPDPDQRPEHDKVRALALMSALKLPPPEARRQQVDEWLKTLNQPATRAGVSAG